MNSQTATRGPSRASYLNRDQRLEILSLHRAGLTYKEIAAQLKVTYSQVKNTVQSGRASPKQRAGRPPKLTSPQIDQLEEFICSSPKTQQMSYLELAIHFSQWDVGESAIRTALKGRGYSRHPLTKYPPAVSGSLNDTESVARATSSQATTILDQGTPERRDGTPERRDSTPERRDVAQ